MSETIAPEIAALGGHIERAFRAKAEEDGRTVGDVVRYVVMAEFISGENSRQLSYILRDRFGHGIYPWEAMGIMDWCRSAIDNCEQCPAMNEDEED